MGIGTLDWIVIAAYFAVVICIAVWAIRKERSGEETSALLALPGTWHAMGVMLSAAGSAPPTVPRFSPVSTPVSGHRSNAPALRRSDSARGHARTVYEPVYRRFRDHYPALKPLFYSG